MSVVQPQSRGRKIILEVALFGLSQVAFYVAFKYLLSALDPTASKKKEAKAKSDAVLRRLQMSGDLKLTEHEQIIASEVVAPEEINVSFNDIGGYDHIVSDLKEGVIYPLTHPHLFNQNKLIGPPKGVLLYGPPGCGKTMLAKALASESGATFINVHISTMTDKWFGESNKLIAALFSLAKKLEPSIIFIDEIDAFLRERSKQDHEATSLIKSEFMSLWDGLLTGENARIVVLGATNRPNDIDSAILRRMPKRFPVRLPNPQQRRKIFEVLLKSSDLEPNFDYNLLVAATEGFSGSDIKESCRHAAMAPVREYIRLNGSDMEKVATEDVKMRPLKVTDFMERIEVDGITSRVLEEATLD